MNSTLVKSGQPSGFIMLNQEETIVRIKVTSLSKEVKIYTLTIIKNKTSMPTIRASACMDTTKKVVIQGNISTGYGQTITAKVIDPNGKVDFVGTTVSTTGGRFEVNYQLSNQSKGKYMVKVSGYGVKEPTSTKFYYLTDVWLKSLTLSDISLSPVFKPEITEYTAIVDGSFDTYTVTPEAIEGAEKIIVNQQTVDSSKASLPIYLREGKNKLKVTVYAHNNDLVKTYTITIKKLKKVPSLTANAKLDNEKQVLIQGNTGMKFSLALPVLITDPNGKIEYANNIKTARDGSFQLSYAMKNTTIGNYKVSVGAYGLVLPAVTYFTYQPMVDLLDLRIESTSLYPTFDKNQLNYSSSVDSTTDSIRVLATAVDPEAKITINGSKVLSDQESTSIALSEGVNHIFVVVTRYDVSKTYEILVYKEEHKQPERSSDATLLSIECDARITPEFEPSITNYTTTISALQYEVIYVAAIANDEKAMVFVNDIPCGQDESIPIEITGAINLPITIKVVAEDGTVMHYNIMVTVEEGMNG